MTVKTGVRAVADVDGGVILASVEIAAPAERVFRALTTDEITAWWGSPDQYRTTGWTGDLRTGGRWRADGVGADGTPFSVEGEFREVDPPRKLVQTWRAAWDGGHETTITYRLEPIDGGTRLTLRHHGFDGRVDSCRGHADGWERVLGWLAGHVAPSAGPRPRSGGGEAVPVPETSRRRPSGFDRRAPSGGEAVEDAPPQPAFHFCRLVPPRPSFAFDMSPEERDVMLLHQAYLRGLMDDGIAIVFGPVADPQGPWGLGVLRVPAGASLEALTANDPAILSNRGFRYETTPMLAGVTRA